MHGTESDWKDPARYSFAHGGKDGTPFPVDEEAMEDTTRFLQTTLQDAEIGKEDKTNALQRLYKTYPRQSQG